MPRASFFIPAVIAVMVIAGCSRSKDVPTETCFYGMWTKGSNAGDTLVFFPRDGKNWLRYNNSLNPQRPLYNEIEFTVRDGNLYLANYLSMLPMTTFSQTKEFSWIVTCAKFRMQVNQLWLFLDAYPAYATFTKLQ